MSAAISLQSLTKVYRRSHLGKMTLSRGIEDVTFDVQNGEVLGLLGLNGAGKTTTLKLILGLLDPTSGSVELAGGRIEDPVVRSRLGYLPETTYFYRYLSAEEVLTFYGRLSGIAKEALPERINAVLKRTRMSEHRHRKMTELSKGMLQRVSIAQALLHNPPILILDEPVTGLDPLGLAEMRDLMGSLHQEGKTILFSSHNIAEVEKICDRAAILHEGRLIRLIHHAEWSHESAGHLEKLFVQEVSR